MLCLMINWWGAMMSFYTRMCYLVIRSERVMWTTLPYNIGTICWFYVYTLVVEVLKMFWNQKENSCCRTLIARPAVHQNTIRIVKVLPKASIHHNLAKVMAYCFVGNTFLADIRCFANAYVLSLMFSSHVLKVGT